MLAVTHRGREEKGTAEAAVDSVSLGSGEGGKRLI